MQVKVIPAPLGGFVSAVPSKSAAHRLLIAASLSERPTELSLPVLGEDLSATVGGLSALGASFHKTENGVRVIPLDPQRIPENPLIDARESGSTLRFLLPVTAALSDQARFTGTGRLPERPIRELLAALTHGGVRFSDERLPFSSSGRLHAGAFCLPGDVSSQYLSGLLLALPLLAGESEVTLTTPLQSSRYVALTMEILRKFGVFSSVKGITFTVSGGQKYRSPGRILTEGDWSGAAFFLAAGALSNELTVIGLSEDSLQPDRAILAYLEDFGAAVQWNKGAVTVSPRPLTGIAADLSETPDLFPVLAVLGAFAAGETRLLNGKRLRQKESDRIAGTAALLTALGGDCTELPDGLIVRGKPLCGGMLPAFHDHRLVMAAALAGTVSQNPTVIRGAEEVRKSDPGFWDHFKKAGGNFDVL